VRMDDDGDRGAANAVGMSIDRGQEQGQGQGQGHSTTGVRMKVRQRRGECCRHENGGAIGADLLRP